MSRLVRAIFGGELELPEDSRQRFVRLNFVQVRVAQNSEKQIYDAFLTVDQVEVAREP